MRLESMLAGVDATLNFIKGAGFQPGSQPGFAHAMNLSYNTVNKAAFTFSEKTLTHRYSFNTTTTPPSLGLLTALMDELSTNACFAVGQPSAPGLSLQMQTELVVSELPTNMDAIDIINVVTKLGRTTSYTRTEFHSADDHQQLLAYSSHVKYMPTGSWFLDLVFNNKFWFGLYKKWLQSKGSPPSFPEKPIQQVMKSTLAFQGIGRATFKVTPEHTNPFGTMHGGCHAMVMELVGEEFAKAELKSAVILEAIQIDYISAAKLNMVVDVECQAMASNNGRLFSRVLTRNPKDRRILSDGKLRFMTKTRSKL